VIVLKAIVRGVKTGLPATVRKATVPVADHPEGTGVTLVRKGAAVENAVPMAHAETGAKAALVPEVEAIGGPLKWRRISRSRSSSPTACTSTIRRTRW
jgi:hypothetical protein